MNQDYSHSEQKRIPCPANIHDQRILILDFGSQYTQLIARRIRECGVYSEIHPYDMSDKEISAFAPSGIILSGGHESVTTLETPRASPIVFELGCPVLGICYGMQTMAAQLGGKVEMSSHREFGYAQLDVHGHCALFWGIEDAISGEGLSQLDVWMSHGDSVTALPLGFSLVATSSAGSGAGFADGSGYGYGGSGIAAMANESRHFYGIQFHPEVTHTAQGMRILTRFVHEICGCQPVWTTGNIIEDAFRRVVEKVSKDQVLLALSGGVDSSVVAALLHKAIGKQLTCVFVDTGLLRLNEGDQVMQTFAEHMGVNVIRVNAQEQFFQALAGISDPEQKRKIMGAEFIKVFEAEAKKLSGIKWLAQGTIYPDVIESAATQTGKAQVIKSHHNVGGLPENMPFQLIEPIRELFKDEVRQMGLELGLPHEMLYRHPFPGPGLGVRILGEVKPDYADILRHADAIFIEELRKNDLYHQIGQAFAVFLPVKSVGVKGDARKYEYVISLRAVETVDFMTAHVVEIPYPILRHIGRRILNEVDHVSRVVYDISDKPPATIEWE